MSKELIEALDRAITGLEWDAIASTDDLKTRQKESDSALLQAHRYAIAAGPVALARFLEIEKDPDSELAEEKPLERLRFFCSLAMSAQNWIDVEPFFDAIEATAQTPAPVVQETREWWDWQGICDAYEGGVGHGRQRRTLSNPHIEGSDGFHAYAYGVEQGNLQQDRADASKADVCTWTSGDEPCAACPQRVTALHMCRLLQDAALPADGGVTDFSLIADMLVHYASLVSEQHSSRFEEFHYVPAIEEQIAALKARGDWLPDAIARRRVADAVRNWRSGLDDAEAALLNIEAALKASCFVLFTHVVWVGKVVAA